MVARSIYEDITSFGLPRIFVGDHGQLEPVNSDFNLMENPDFTLEKIHRNSGEIPRFAEWLRLGRPAREFKATSDAVCFFGAPRLTMQRLCGSNHLRVQQVARRVHQPSGD